MQIIIYTCSVGHCMSYEVLFNCFSKKKAHRSICINCYLKNGIYKKILEKDTAMKQNRKVSKINSTLRNVGCRENKAKC